ncbi:MAG: hypothetical protein AB2L24_27940 [Mangrovibacterium sp.]
MKVLKFGGTSVGSAENMYAVMKLITDGEKKLVVLSAMSGTTNDLVEIADYLYKKNKDGARVHINKLEKKYEAVTNSLYKTEESKKAATRRHPSNIRYDQVIYFGRFYRGR